MYNFIHTYDEMPKWKDTAEGMETVEIDVSNLCVTTLPLVEYAVKDDYSLNIRFVFPEGRDLETRRILPTPSPRQCSRRFPGCALSGSRNTPERG